MATLQERIQELATAIGADVKSIFSRVTALENANNEGGNVGVAVDGGNATTSYIEPAIRIDFGKSN